jgi:quinol monooxygenase YgiN
MPAGVVAVTRIHGVAGRRQALRDLIATTQERVAHEPRCRGYRRCQANQRASSLCGAPPSLSGCRSA